MEFEQLEQIALADRHDWESVLKKITTDNPTLYKWLQLTHNNADGKNDKQISQLIAENYWTNTPYSKRFDLDRFDQLSSYEQQSIIDSIRNKLSLYVSDVKIDTSVSYATDFVPKKLDFSTMFVRKGQTFKLLTSFSIWVHALSQLFLFWKFISDRFLSSLFSLQRTFDYSFNQAAATGFQHSELQNAFVQDLAIDWLSNHPNTDRYTFDRIMEKIQSADHPKIVPLLAKQLTRPAVDSPKNFGAESWHTNLLTLTQLEELEKLAPNVKSSTSYVQTVMRRLMKDHVSIDKDAAAYEQAIEPVVAFVKTLSDAFIIYKVVLFYHLLDAQVRQGKFIEASLHQYLAIPKYSNYYNYSFVDTHKKKGVEVPYITSMEVTSFIGPDSISEEMLIKTALTHFMLEFPSYPKYFDDFISADWLKDLYARVKILYGPPNQLDQNAKLLRSQSELPAIRKEIRLNIDPYAPKYWSSASAVTLKVEVKNIQKLIVKLFEINTMRYYKDNLNQIPSDISLDGLVASEELQYEYSEADHVSVWREYSFKSLENQSGVYVLEFVGGGLCERAVIYKGRLNAVQRPSIAGHKFTLMNEKNEKLVPAHLWLDGRLYNTDEDGEIIVPYSTSSSTSKTAIIFGGSGDESSPFCDLFQFQHQTESYSFKCGFFIDRESLVPFNKTSVLLRPSVFLNDCVVTPVSLLTDSFLSISTTDIDGVSSSKEVPVKFADDAETTFEFQVPDKLQSLAFSVRTNIKTVTTSAKIPFHAGYNCKLNEIDKTDQIEQIFLRRTAQDDYSLHLFGKTGDAIPRREVAVTFKPFFFPNLCTTHTLTTDDDGLIPLGPLPDMIQISALDHTFPLTAAYNYNLLTPTTLHLKANQVLQVAVSELEIPSGGVLNPNWVSLHSLTTLGGLSLANFFHLLKLENGILTSQRGLLPGVYKLFLKRTNRSISIIVEQALQNHSDFLFGPSYILQKSTLSRPLQVTSIADTDDSVVINLLNFSPSTRIHIFPSEYIPEYDVRGLFDSFTQSPIARIKTFEGKKAQYISRTLGEEQRYILDRRYLKPRQGNTLTPPSLLLNPWAVDTTKTARKDATGGSHFESSAPSSGYGNSYASSSIFGSLSSQTRNDRNFDFKFYNCKAQYNLKADDNGVLAINRASLGGTPGAPLLIRVVVMDSAEMVFREFTSKGKEQPEKAIAAKDLRLKQARALAPAEHFAEQKGVSSLQLGEKFQVADLSTSKIEILDSMAKVYSFFSTISGDSNLKEWNWLLKWDSLSIAEKEEKYHEYASHELHVFIYFKDRKFFEKVVAPFIASKLQKTFIDEWLLIKDAKFFHKYLNPALLTTLNGAEKAFLAHRLCGTEGADFAKSLNDLSSAIALAKSDRNLFNHLFKTVLGSSSLDTESDGYVPQKEETKELMERESLPPLAAISFASAPPPMAGPPRAAPASRSRMAAVPAQMEREVMKEEEESDITKKKSRKTSLGYAKEKKKRDKVEQLFQAPEKTKKYAESQYYKQPDPSISATLVPMRSFWSDYALHSSAKAGSAFVSQNWIYATHSFTEMVFAMAVLDLPLTKPNVPHHTEFVDGGMTLTASAPVVIFHKDIKTCPLNKRQVLVTQTFFDPSDRHTTLNGERVEKYIEEEFLNRKVYGCNYIVTNISSTTQRVEALLQVPVGSIPVLSGSYTKSVFMEVPSYTTQSGHFYFYFPRTGDYPVFPVHISRDERTISVAGLQLPNGTPSLHVVNQLSKHDLKSWTSYISQLAPNDQVFEYLQYDDIFTVDLGLIAWRMRDASFFKRATSILRARAIFNKKLWAYSTVHNDKQAFSELLNSDMNQLVDLIGINAHLRSFPDVTTHAWATKKRQHYEFWPLINARAHQLGAKRQILNDGFKSTYRTFLTDLTFKTLLSKDDLLMACYFMLLQDRIEEGTVLFERAKKAPLDTFSTADSIQIQSDYLTAYLDFFNETPKVAREIAGKYLDYPILRWRRMFQNIKQQLEEFDSGLRPADLVDPDERNARMSKSANDEPTLEVETAPGTLFLNHHSLSTAVINFYKMDIELLFSSADYKPTDLGKFAYVKPNITITVPLAMEGNETAVAVPPELDNCNVMVEVNAGPLSKVVSYFSHSLLSKVSQSFGQIQIHDKNTGRPLARVYIKVFAHNKDGSSRFYKDGYTDLRGAFDYASLSTDELGNVKKFSILVMSLNNGTRILEAAPPAQ